MKQLNPTVDAGAAVVRFLHDRDRDAIEVPSELHGFGGLHGGLLLGRAALAAQDAAPGRVITAVTGHFHQAARGRLELATRVIRESGTTTTVAVEVTGARGTLCTATVVATDPSTGPAVVPAWAPPPPEGVGWPEQWERFEVPPELVPIGASTEIRPVGPARPFAGGTSPELVAWVRIRDDGAPVDLGRFLFLVDALAPSLAAVLTDPVPIPTVELAARPGPELGVDPSPWVLLRARTEVVGAGGWHDERIDAWDRAGRHLGAARQLRVVRAPAPAATCARTSTRPGGDLASCAAWR